MSTAAAPVYAWADLHWRVIEKQVYKRQKRIYQASQRGDVTTVHRLQRLLMRSWAAQCLATRRVTQDNRGKRTAGIDGIKNVAPERRLVLAGLLTLQGKASPTRRVWIPKPGTAEKRGLGIPTMHNRAEQALVKLALEPEWEAQFEANSYGFRPGRSCHDAIEAIFLCIRFKPKYVLDADIAKCFDRINHRALLDKLHTFPTLRRVIKAWLKAGVMDGDTLLPTNEGTPQGGVATPPTIVQNGPLRSLSPFPGRTCACRMGRALWHVRPKSSLPLKDVTLTCTLRNEKVEMRDAAADLTPTAR